jgi:hypothetical protein
VVSDSDDEGTGGQATPNEGRSKNKKPVRPSTADIKMKKRMDAINTPLDSDSTDDEEEIIATVRLPTTVPHNLSGTFMVHVWNPAHEQQESKKATTRLKVNPSIFLQKVYEVVAKKWHEEITVDALNLTVDGNRLEPERTFGTCGILTDADALRIEARRRIAPLESDEDGAGDGLEVTAPGGDCGAAGGGDGGGAAMCKVVIRNNEGAEQKFKFPWHQELGKIFDVWRAVFQICYWRIHFSRAPHCRS